MITGKLEITIKINELTQAKTLENSWQQFDIGCDRRIISVKLKPKVWKELSDVASNSPQWLTAISNEKPRSVYAGKLGHQKDSDSSWMNLIYILSVSIRQKQQLRQVQLEPG